MHVFTRKTDRILVKDFTKKTRYLKISCYNKMNFLSYFKRKPEPIPVSNNDVESFEFIDINSTLPITINVPSPTHKESELITENKDSIKEESESAMVDITTRETTIYPYSISPPLRHRVFIEQPIEYESFPISNYNSFSPKNSEEFTDMDLAVQSIIHLILGKDVVDRIASHHRPSMGIL